MKTIFGNPVVQLAIGLIVLSLLPAVTSLPLERVTEIVISTLDAGGIILLVGYLGLTPFGGSIFYALAGYAAAISMTSWFAGTNEFYGMALAVVVCVLIAFPVGALILRRRGLYFSLLTVACCQIMYEIAFAWTSVTGGENGIQNVPRPILDTTVKFHAFAVVIVIAAFWLMWRIAHSPLGRLFQAVRDNEERTASLGYSVYLIKLSAFVLFAAITGLAGSLMTFYIRGMYANSLSFEHAADPLMISVLGGIFHPMGALWGAALFVILEDQLSAVVQYWWLVFAPTLIFVALAAPEGIHGLFGRAFGHQRWTLVRRGIPVRPDRISPFHASGGEGEGDRQSLMEVRGLTKRFGSLVVASGYDFEAIRGEVHSFIGPNGAGKTTFFNMLSGLVVPNGGTVTFAGRDVTRLPIHQRSRLGLSRSFQIVSVFQNLTAFENIRIAVQATRPAAYAFWRDAYANSDINERVWSILDAVGLTERAASRCTDLSHGERRLLDIALTLATNASVLLLDEPLAGLGEADRNRVAGLIRSLGKTHAVVLIEHDIDRVLALSDKISVLHQGRIIASGKPADIAGNADVRRAYLGESTALHPARTPVLRDMKEQPVLLEARGISAGYGGGRVIDGISLTVHEGEAIGILGRNGVGKTTLLRALYRLLPVDEGTVVWSGADIVKLKPFEVNRLGLSIVPEGRRLFHNLTTLENLQVASRPGGLPIDEIFVLFPRLKTVQNSRAANLSGGERQMVAIARALVAPTSLILLDEPFEGLAPAVVAEVMTALLKLRGRVALVLVEHHAEQVLSVVDRAIVLVNGRVAWEGAAAELADQPQLQARLLGLVDDGSHERPEIEQHG
jgi:branched-chain amino acid transport system ATP-binding protein